MARLTKRDLHQLAEEAARVGDEKGAEKLYQQAARKYPMDDHAYRRLMVYYRKRREYGKELEVIQTAIRAHKDHESNIQQQWLRIHKDKARTAKALAKSLGLVDKKGLPKIQDAQVDAWEKRMAFVRKRFKATPPNPISKKITINNRKR